MPTDGKILTYGLAFALLAYSKVRIIVHSQKNTYHCARSLPLREIIHNQALRTGVEEAREYVEETWATLERRLWLPEHGLYAEEADENWRVDPYRSESGNLHMTEGRRDI